MNHKDVSTRQYALGPLNFSFPLRSIFKESHAEDLLQIEVYYVVIQIVSLDPKWA